MARPTPLIEVPARIERPRRNYQHEKFYIAMGGEKFDIERPEAERLTLPKRIFGRDFIARFYTEPVRGASKLTLADGFLSFKGLSTGLQTDKLTNIFDPVPLPRIVYLRLTRTR